jgi:hypothetical protein
MNFGIPQDSDSYFSLKGQKDRQEKQIQRKKLKDALQTEGPQYIPHRVIVD